MECWLWSVCMGRFCCVVEFLCGVLLSSVLIERLCGVFLSSVLIECFFIEHFFRALVSSIFVERSRVLIER